MSVVDISKYRPLEELPPAPDWLPDDIATDQWDLLCRILKASDALNEAVLAALATLCALHSDIVNAYRQGIRPHATMLTVYRAFLNDFALTPVAQQQAAARHKAPDEPKPKNAFGRFGRPDKPNKS